MKIVRSAGRCSITRRLTNYLDKISQVEFLMRKIGLFKFALKDKPWYKSIFND